MNYYSIELMRRTDNVNKLTLNMNEVMITKFELRYKSVVNKLTLKLNKQSIT